MSHHFSRGLFQSAAPFSHACRVGDLWFISGIIGQRRDTGELVSTELGLQARTMFDNLDLLLDELGVRPAGIARTCLYLTDYADFDELNVIYAERIESPYPARTTLETAALPLGAKVQIDAIARA
ncbi:MAG: RidA family protein [Sinomonas sp.]|nr:RidA family protein [Sinomonas sp.]